MLAHLRGASVKNTKKNSENAMRKPPMDDCGAKKAVSIPEEQIRPCGDRRNAVGQGAQVRRSLYVLRQRGCAVDGDGLRIAGEDLVHHRAIRLFREQTDDRHHNESDEHGEHSRVDRGGKGRVDKRYARQSADEVRRHQTHAADEACPDRRPGDFPAVEAVEEGREEGTGKRTPRYAHQLCDKGDGGGMLHDGDHGGNGDEEHDQYANDGHLPLFRDFLLLHGRHDEV